MHQRQQQHLPHKFSHQRHQQFHYHTISNFLYSSLFNQSVATTVKTPLHSTCQRCMYVYEYIWVHMYTIIYTFKIVPLYYIATYSRYIDFWFSKSHSLFLVSSLFGTYPDFWLLSGVCLCSSAQQITLYIVAFWLILWKWFFWYHFFVELCENSQKTYARTHVGQHEFRIEKVPHSINSQKYVLI